MTKTMLEPISFDGIEDKIGVEKAILQACSPKQMAKIRAMDREIRKSIASLPKPTQEELLAKVKAMAQNAR
ncbi:hypothetical protein [Helicobacter ailurogastricus]|uniref:Uncharacterized protein n=1 Tax=Helicobacter ailurogastricus TaxID=1578720 RepID=A0A0K2X564_9HELI|nr:hypothetical protein [Helicobacter ailurogastricus]CRF40965.1 hypothetical protein HAL011_07410 [Helicobacter ailurogastricus]CRF42360.1 hypothetical protein HAL013_05300 [Helicobacter ailurogastricus]CRF44615.1 hypothetical protein HAL09_12090 [Helicobacter ailurogastricus]